MPAAVSVLFLLGVTGASAFSIIQYSPADVVTVSEGESFTLNCNADGYYEWCTFKQSSGSICDFEWKRAQWNITEQECSFQGRAHFQGVYDDHECGLFVENANLKDSGTWSCVLEEYVKGGSRGSGELVSQTFTIIVEDPTVTESASTTTSTTTSTTSTTSTTTTTEYYQYDYGDDSSDPEDDDDAAAAEAPEDDSDSAAPAAPAVPEENNSEGIAADDESVTEAVTGGEDEKEEDEEGSAGLPVGLSVCVIIVFVTVGALLLLHYKRKLHPCCYRLVNRPWKPVLTNVDEYPVTEDQEKHPSIIKNTAREVNLSLNGITPVDEEDGGEAQLAADLTTVSWVNEDKIEDVEDKGKTVEDKEEAGENTPLQDEENVQK